VWMGFARTACTCAELQKPEGPRQEDLNVQHRTPNAQRRTRYSADL